AAADLMKVGVPAQISANDSSGQTIAGTITRTSDAVDPKARTFRAELDIPNPDRRLVPGLYVQVSFQLQNSGLSQVPAAALVFRSSGHDRSRRRRFRRTELRCSEWPEAGAQHQQPDHGGGKGAGKRRRRQWLGCGTANALT